MKIVTAVRHAKSSWSNSSLSDQQRPLNGRGKRAAPAVAAHLSKMGHQPDLILSSPARRALDTAKLFAENFSYPAEGIEIDRRLYFAGSDAIADAIREQDDKFQHLFFFSHEPVISEFCEEMSGETIWKYPTAAAFAIQFPIDSWKDFGVVGKKLFFMKPKEIAEGL